MEHKQFVICHTEHEIDVNGVNAGAEMATRHLARFLAKLGYKVSVLGVIKDGDQNQDGVQYIDLGSSYDVQSGLNKIRKAGAYHLIAGGRAIPIFLAKDDPLCASKILITHDRAGNDTGIKPPVLCQNLDKVVCVSNAQREVFLEAGADPAKTITVHNGVDLNIFKANPPENRNFRRLVFAGALIQDKGIQVLIPAFAKLKQKYPDLTLDVYGAASLWDREPMFNEKDIEAQLPGIKFHGKVPQTIIATAFQEAGICVIPSIWFDPFPLTALEAQVTGCPAVAFDVGGLREGIRDQETGVVLTDISEDALVNCLDQLLANPNRLVEMSNKALETARSYFTWERVAKEIAKLSGASPITKSIVSNENKVALLTSWSDGSELANFARKLVETSTNDNLIVLGEKESPTTNNSTACWSYSDFSKIAELIESNSLSKLYINLDPECFDIDQLSKLTKLANSANIPVNAILHQALPATKSTQELFDTLDSVFVHSEIVELEAIGMGAPSTKIKRTLYPITTLEELSKAEIDTIKTELDLSSAKKTIFLVGDSHPENGLEALLEVLIHLEQKLIPCHGVIIGNLDTSNSEAVNYRQQLEALVEQHNLSNRICFVDRPNDEQLSQWLTMADLVLLNTKSNNNLVSHTCSLAIGAGALVAASTDPQYNYFSGGIWRMTSGYPAALSAELLLGNHELQESIKSAASNISVNSNWHNYVEQIFEEKPHKLLEQTGTITTDKDLNTLPLNQLIDNAEQALEAQKTFEAHQYFEQAITKDSSSARAWKGRGATFFSEQKYDQALTCFEIALKHESSNTKALFGASLCHISLTNWSKAKDLLIRILKKDLSFESALTQLISVSYQLNEFDDLIDILYKYVTEYPDSMDMRYCLAAALFKHGNLGSAAEMLAEVTLRQPDHKGAKELQQQIKLANTTTTIEKSVHTNTKDTQATPLWPESNSSKIKSWKSE